MAEINHRTQILVALIGAVALIVAAYISNLPKNGEIEKPKSSDQKNDSVNKHESKTVHPGSLEGGQKDNTSKPAEYTELAQKYIGEWKNVNDNTDSVVKVYITGGDKPNDIRIKWEKKHNFIEAERFLYGFQVKAANEINIKKFTHFKVDYQPTFSMQGELLIMYNPYVDDHNIDKIFPAFIEQFQRIN